MAQDFNSIMITGRLTKDAKIREVTSNDKTQHVLSFSVASTVRNWKSRDGEWKERTEYYEVERWYTGEAPTSFANLLTKGREVAIYNPVVGSRAYLGEDGEPRAVTTLRVDMEADIKLGRAAHGSSNGGSSYDDYSPAPDSLDDIPF